MTASSSRSTWSGPAARQRQLISSSTLTADELGRLEAPYTPRHDFQGISDDRELAAIAARLPQFTTA